MAKKVMSYGQQFSQQQVTQPYLRISTPTFNSYNFDSNLFDSKLISLDSCKQNLQIWLDLAVGYLKPNPYNPDL